MGKCVEMVRHDKCGSSRLQVFLQDNGSYDGFCFGCGESVAHPYKDKPEGYKPQVKIKTKEDIEKEIKEIGGYRCLDLPKRALKRVALEHFGVKIGVSEADGTTPESYYFPYRKDGELTGYKVGLFELGENGKKRVWSLGAVKDVDLFGWEEAIGTGAKRVYITEGEFDAVALWQMIMKQQFGGPYEKNIPAVCSIPHGASAATKDISKIIGKLRRHFQEIVLVFDNDKPGKDAEADVLKNFPDFMAVTLPKKDANECLKEGLIKAAVNACMFKAEKPKNTRLVMASSLIEAARKEAEWGLSWPWRRMTELTRGMRLGETYYFGSGVKMGKSELVNAIAAHCIIEHKWKVFMAKPEEANVKTVKMMAGKVAGRIFHDPKIPFDHDAYDKASKVIAENLYMVNLYQHMGWASLEADIREAAALGCKAIFIDPITNLTVGMDSAEANTKLVEIAVALSSMALDLNVIIFIFCHLKAPEKGDPHERGGKVMSVQFAGSRAMMRSCNYALGMEGNKDPDLPEEERNKRKLVLLEDREFGSVGEIPLIWSPVTGMFKEL